MLYRRRQGAQYFKAFYWNGAFGVFQGKKALPARHLALGRHPQERTLHEAWAWRGTVFLVRWYIKLGVSSGLLSSGSKLGKVVNRTERLQNQDPLIHAFTTMTLSWVLKM